MIDPSAAAGMSGDVVVDPDGREVGRVVEVYLDDSTGRPAWASLSDGPGDRRTFVPLAQAEFMGNRLRLPYEKALVEAAPRVGAASGHLTAEQTAALEGHYRTRSDGAAVPAAGSEDHGVAVTRSAEQLRVRTEWVGSERVRLRKVVVTENVTVTVPVSHEELRVERVPLDDDGTDEDAGTAPGGPGLQHEMVLHAQRPVVTTEVVPVERVRVSTVVVDGRTTVTEALREERVQVDPGPAPDAGRR